MKKGIAGKSVEELYDDKEHASCKHTKIIEILYTHAQEPADEQALQEARKDCEKTDDKKN